MDLTEAGWSVEHGQAVWQPKGPSRKGVTKGGGNDLAGEFLAGRNRDGRLFVQFSKTPFPILTAQTTKSRWQIEIPVEKKRYTGAGKPPARFAWLQFARALAGEAPGAGWSWRREGQQFRLENLTTGESVEGYLAE